MTDFAVGAGGLQQLAPQNPLIVSGLREDVEISISPSLLIPLFKWPAGRRAGLVYRLSQASG